MPPRRRRTSNDPLSSSNKAPKKLKIEENTENSEDENKSVAKVGKSPDNFDTSLDLLEEIPEPKVKKQRERGTYNRYDKEDLLEAVKMVKAKKMSLNTASRSYNVPKTTICNYVMNGDKEQSKRGVEPTLKPEEEQQILSWLLDGSDMGDPRYQEDLPQAAFDVLKLHNRSSVFKNGIPTHSWVKTFTNRHKNCVRMKKTGAQVDEGKFFHKFYAFLEKNDYLDVLKRPDAFYIIEDNNFELDTEKISSERRMLLKKSLIKKLDEPSTFRLEKSVTVTYGFGANGRSLQQLLIFRENFKDMVSVARADQKLNAKFLFTRTHDGGNTRDTFRCYLERLDAQLSDVQRPIFIFCSPTLPRVGIELSKWCNEKKIFVISFIPGGVSVLRNIHDGIFGIKNTAWITEIDEYQEQNDLTTFSEVDFVSVLKTMNDRIIDETKIFNSFAEAGIYPFDAEKMNDSISDLETEQEEDPNDSKKKSIHVIIKRMHEMNQELIKLLKRDKREDLLLNAKIITQQLEFIESSF